MKRRILLSSLIPAILVGCASTKIRNWKIVEIPGIVRTGMGITVGIRSIGLPPTMNQMGIPEAGSAYTANTFPNDLWAAQLGGMLQIAMVQNLAQRLPLDTILADGGAIGAAPDQWVEIQVLDFSSDRNGKISLSAQVATRASSSQSWHLKRFQASIAGGKTAEGTVAAMSVLWGQASDCVANMLS